MSRRRTTPGLWQTFAPRGTDREEHLDKSELLKELHIDRGARGDGSPSRARLWSGLVVALILIGAVLAWLMRGDPAIEVTTAEARAKPATSAGTSVLDATGYVTARRQATVSAKITGKVREVRIEEGQHVAAGDILATLEDSEAQVDLELRRAQVAAARTQQTEAEAAAANSEREYGRQQELAALKLTSVSALDAAHRSSSP